MPQDRPRVPEWLRGCWQRAWIEFDDGSRNDTDRVFWLQTASSMADIRIPGPRPSFDGVESLSACSASQLSVLAGSIAGTGFTTCTDVSVTADGARSCVAEWFSYGHGINFQPVCSFPEPGHLLLDQDGTVMIERAPSGRYTEEWHLVAGSRDGRPRHEVLADGRQLFVTGSVAVVVRDRAVALPNDALPNDTSLEALAADARCTRPELEALLDCEFSVALQGVDGVHRISASTLPWREGRALDAPV